MGGAAGVRELWFELELQRRLGADRDVARCRPEVNAVHPIDRGYIRHIVQLERRIGRCAIDPDTGRHITRAGNGGGVGDYITRRTWRAATSLTPSGLWPMMCPHKSIQSCT